MWLNPISFGNGHWRHLRGASRPAHCLPASGAGQRLSVLSGKAYYLQTLCLAVQVAKITLESQLTATLPLGFPP